MNISERTINALAKIVTGDGGLSPYRSGSVLVRLFNEYGRNDVYGKGFPSRWQYVEDCIRFFNKKNTKALYGLMRHVFDPREFLDTRFDVNKVIESFNCYLKYDGYEVEIINDKAVIRDLEGDSVEFDSPFNDSQKDAHTFIKEQTEKCDAKIASEDYCGAITNARSLLEAVLVEIEKELDSKAAEYDGDLIKLYRRIQKMLNLEPSRKDISDTLKQILSGLVSVVTGLASLRNKMSDAHVATYRPDKHHAVLAVNAAKTLANFIVSTKEYQKK
ncbi:MAG: abortive infection family protein [Phycisphaerae bacterium]